VRTLGDPVALERMLGRLAQRGPVLAPELFRPEFVRRTTLRFRFASVRASSQGLQEMADRTGGWQGRALGVVAQVVPARVRWARIALAFAILRPFDLLTTLLYRVFAWMLVRLRQTDT